MELTENLRTAMKGLSGHKLRTFLTMLGVIFGVAAVIAMVSIGAGAKQEAIRQIELMGMNSIYVRPKELHGDALREAKRKSPDGLTVQDMVSVREICPLIEGVAAVREVDEEIRYRGRSPESNVISTDPNYLPVTGSKLERGRFLTDADLIHYVRVCVIGADIKRDLFAFDDPLRAQIQIGKEWFTVVGVIEDKQISRGRANVIDIRNLNRDLYIPVTTAEQRFMPDPEEEQRLLLDYRHRYPEDDWARRRLAQRAYLDGDEQEALAQLDRLLARAPDRHDVREMAHDLDAAAIMALTASGHTARLVSQYRPKVPIIAVTPSQFVQRQLMLCWGVTPLLAVRADSTDEMISYAVRIAAEHGLVEPGDKLVVTAGAAGSAPGTTNLLRVLAVGEETLATQ